MGVRGLPLFDIVDSVVGAEELESNDVRTSAPSGEMLDK